MKQNEFRSTIRNKSLIVFPSEDGHYFRDRVHTTRAGRCGAAAGAREQQPSPVPAHGQWSPVSRSGDLGQCRHISYIYISTSVSTYLDSAGVTPWPPPDSDLSTRRHQPAGNRESININNIRRRIYQETVIKVSPEIGIRENKGRHTWAVVLKFFVERTDFTKSLRSSLILL